MNWKAFFWNHRSSWANMFSGLATVVGSLQAVKPVSALVTAAIFNAIGVVLNTFPDMSKEP